MYFFACVCVHVCLGFCLYICVSVCVYMNVFVCVGVFVSVCECVLNECMSVHASLCVHVNARVYVCQCSRADFVACVSCSLFSWSISRSLSLSVLLFFAVMAIHTLLCALSFCFLFSL